MIIGKIKNLSKQLTLRKVNSTTPSPSLVRRGGVHHRRAARDTPLLTKEGLGVVVRKVSKPLLLGILLLTYPVVMLALDKPLDGQIIQLLRILATVHTSTTRFTEEKTLSVLDKPLMITGTLRYDAPDHLQKQVTSPQPESYDIRGEQLTIITNEGRRELSLGDYPLLRIFVESLRATLAGEIDTLDRYYLMQFTGTLKEWQLTLLPRDNTIKPYVSQIIIRGQNQHLKHLEIYESNGDKSLMTMTPLNEQ